MLKGAKNGMLSLNRDESSLIAGRKSGLLKIEEEPAGSFVEIQAETGYMKVD